MLSENKTQLHLVDSGLFESMASLMISVARSNVGIGTYVNGLTVSYNRRNFGPFYLGSGFNSTVEFVRTTETSEKPSQVRLRASENSGVLKVELGRTFMFGGVISRIREVANCEYMLGSKKVEYLGATPGAEFPNVDQASEMISNLNLMLGGLVNGDGIVTPSWKVEGLK